LETQPTDFPYLMINEKPVYLSAEAIEWLACEYRKYRNLHEGGGRKRKYYNSSFSLTDWSSLFVLSWPHVTLITEAVISFIHLTT
jgi:hypothetical protein